MGVRLYDPGTGRFWSTDPEPGGNATAYDYCSADPVNCTDLTGRFGFKSLLKKVAKVAEVASMIPGPIGAVSAGISAGAYAATGNKGKALEMGLTAAANMVGAGGVVKAGAAIARSAGKVAARAGKAVAKAGKACNSFTPETGVLMADGSTRAISNIQAGELVAARDPVTGELTAQPVLDVIVGHGDKHLIRVITAPAPDEVLHEGQIANDDPRADTWTATANHPIWVENQGWTDADVLATGDLMEGASGELRVVQDVEDEGWLHDQTVYNLSVANVHTYIVGDTGDGTLAHNASCGVIDPSVVRFTQSSASRTFRDGRSVGDLAAGLRSGSMSPGAVAPVRLVRRGENLYSLDNRRLGAFREAGKMMPYRMATRREIANEWSRKFTTKNGGRSIRWR